MPLSPFAVRGASSVMKRSVLAIIMGYITAVTLVLVSFAVLMQLRPDLFPNIAGGEKPEFAVLVITLVLGLLAAVAGGYTTAVIAKSSERTLAEVLGGVMILLGIITMLMEQGVKPLWWHISMFALLIPCTVLGASFKASKKKKWFR
jgi:hypothetical protein